MSRVFRVRHHPHRLRVHLTRGREVGPLEPSQPGFVLVVPDAAGRHARLPHPRGDVQVQPLGAEPLHEPRLWPEYHPNYYGAFVRDPDGNNVEAVFHG